MSNLNERDQEYLKNQLEFIEKRIKYNLQTKNRRSGRKRFYFAKQINYIATYSIENPKSFLDLIRDTETTTETLVMCLQQIIQGICMLRKNQISHNDLHAGNILFDKNLKAHIFDFDRSYSTSLGNNQLEGFEYINNQNVFNDWPLDFYKILCYVPIAVRDKIYAIIGKKNPMQKYYVFTQMLNNQKENGCFFMNNLFNNEIFLTNFAQFFDNDLENVNNKIKNYLEDIGRTEYCYKMVEELKEQDSKIASEEGKEFVKNILEDLDYKIYELKNIELPPTFLAEPKSQLRKSLRLQKIEPEIKELHIGKESLNRKRVFNAVKTIEKNNGSKNILYVAKRNKNEPKKSSKFGMGLVEYSQPENVFKSKYTLVEDQIYQNKTMGDIFIESDMYTPQLNSQQLEKEESTKKLEDYETIEHSYYPILDLLVIYI